MYYQGAYGSWDTQGGYGGNSGGGGGGGGGGRSNYGGAGMNKTTIQVPSNSVGRLIGRGGSKIRELQEQSNCQIKVLQGEDSGSDQTSVEITYNTAQDLEYATSLIRTTVDDSDSGRYQSRGGGGNGGGGGGGYSAAIPEDCVGMVIGKGGAHIKDVAYRVGCPVRVKKDGNGNHYAEVQGNEEQFRQVQDIINQMVERQKMRD